jgi:hypothetical protein
MELPTEITSTLTISPITSNDMRRRVPRRPAPG